MKKPSLFGAVCAVLFTAAPLSVHATTVWSANLIDNWGVSWTLHVITDSDTFDQDHTGAASVYLDNENVNGAVDPGQLLECHPYCIDLIITGVSPPPHDAASLTKTDFDGSVGIFTDTLKQPTTAFDHTGTLECNSVMCSLYNTNWSGPSGTPTTFYASDYPVITFTAYIPPPPTTEESIEQLVTVVIALNLQNGISNALDSKLDSAIQALDDANTNNDVSVSNSLQAFINSVEAQRGNKIPDAGADALIAEAQAIIDSLTQ